ncbi:MAG TPA: protocatechuate 3,4-dioxygenase [Blastocatellia bacterium]|nr:protocatechuate 3,4-dioxygenase [Blastocatellia bacterium]
MKYQRKALSRRELLEMAMALGGLAIAQPISSVFGQEGKRRLTPEQIMGPFYPILKPLEQDADLTVIRGKHGHAQGKIIHLTGQVLNQNGEPVRGAKIEIWQANTHGRYAHPSDTNSAPLDANFQGYSVQTTDAEGHYRFKTIKPGAYRVDANSMRTPHIHFDVMGKKDRLVTQMYFPGEPLNEKDAIFMGLGSDKDAAIGKVLPPAKNLEPDSLLMVWDIILDKG